MSHLILLIILLLAAITLYAFCECFYQKNKRKTMTDFLYAEHKAANDELVCSLMDKLLVYPCQKVEITSHDGLKLVGHYYHVKVGAPMEIGFHGYRSGAVRDFCGGSQTCLENGINLLLVDQRAHGKSEGNVISFGINERFDCLDWVRYAVSRFGNDVKIALSGVSMGAATVLMASELEMPHNVRCIVADCPYSSPVEIIKLVCAGRKLPPQVMYPFIKLSAKIFGGFDLEESSAVNSVSNTKIPVLIVHGEADGFVPCQMGKDIYSACSSQKVMLTIPNADHAKSYIVDTETYKHTVKQFFDKFLY